MMLGAGHNSLLSVLFIISALQAPRTTEATIYERLAPGLCYGPLNYLGQETNYNYILKHNVLSSNACSDECDQVRRDEMVRLTRQGMDGEERLEFQRHFRGFAYVRPVPEADKNELAHMYNEYDCYCFYDAGYLPGVITSQSNDSLKGITVDGDLSSGAMESLTLEWSYDGMGDAVGKIAGANGASNVFCFDIVFPVPEEDPSR